MKVRKNLSLDEEVLRKAKEKAKVLGFDFSNYITYLINKDLIGFEVTETKPIKSTKVRNAIDSILGE